MPRLSLDGIHPELDPSCWIAPSATVIGRVEMAAQSSAWFNTVIRADNDLIRIGARSNIQDGAVLHTDAGVQLLIGEDVTVGHLAMLHGCTIGDGSLIGINAVILNHAVIGRGCLIGANSFIPEGKVIPDFSVVMGSPGKVVRTLDETAVARLLGSASNYVKQSARYRAALADAP